MYLVNFPQQSNSSDWLETIQLISEDDGTPLDLTGCTVKIGVWTQTQRGQGNALSTVWGFAGNATPVLTAASNDGSGKLTILPEGVIQISFRVSDMQSLVAAYYEVGMILTNGTDTIQLVLGVLPVVNGGIIS